MTNVLAFDRAHSCRLYDEDNGRLHVDVTNISKAGVNTYFGREMPGAEKAGLDPNKQYRMFRPPEELAKAAQTFNRVPVLTKHPERAFTAMDHESFKHQVAGTIGSNARYDHPYLKADLSVWNKRDIDGIAMDAARELSACYYYQIDMTPGTYEGQPYDGRMTNIRGHHVALVPVGRAGPDVLVADSGEDALSDQNTGGHPPANQEPLRTFAEPVAAMDAAQVQAAIDKAVAPLKAEAADLKTQLAAADQRQKEAVKAAMDETKQHMRDLEQARADVRPLVGETVGMDSADEVYAYALKHKGVDIEGVHPSALKAMVKMAAAQPVAKPVAAMDAAAEKTYSERWNSPYLQNTGV